jgi:hypothetical protein
MQITLRHPVDSVMSHNPDTNIGPQPSATSGDRWCQALENGCRSKQPLGPQGAQDDDKDLQAAQRDRCRSTVLAIFALLGTMHAGRLHAWVGVPLPKRHSADNQCTPISLPSPCKQVEESEVAECSLDTHACADDSLTRMHMSASAALTRKKYITSWVMSSGRTRFSPRTPAKHLRVSVCVWHQSVDLMLHAIQVIAAAS